MATTPKTLSDQLSVSSQIGPGDVAALKALGFRSIICNRPDGESPDQPSFAEIADAASGQGLEVRHIPIAGGNFGDADVAAFGAALDDLPGPVLAYCRTGTRSATLWSLSQARTRTIPDILVATQNAGYDMSGIVQRMSQADLPEGDAARSRTDG